MTAYQIGEIELNYHRYHQKLGDYEIEQGFELWPGINDEIAEHDMLREMNRS